MDNIPVLVKRCLAHGVVILPYRLNPVIAKSNQYDIPDQFLNAFSKEDLKKYVDALYLSTLEDARDWSRGHEKLIELGFKRSERHEGHRVFVSMIYDATEEA